MQSLRSHYRRPSRIRDAFACGFLLLVAACSNPLSSKKSDQLQNFHSKNTNCDALDFSDGSITVLKVRELTHCLNAHAEVNALETVLNSIPDSDLTPVVTYLNEMVTSKPRFLFALRETYQHAKKTGDLKSLEDTLAKLFADSGRNAGLTQVVQKVANPVLDALLDPELKGSFSNFTVLSKSRAYQRLGSEYLATDGLNRILSATAHYERASDAKSLKNLYDFITSGGLDTVWLHFTAKDEEGKIQKLAHFFEWLESDGHYDLLSSSVRQMITKPVVCFNGTRKVPDSIEAVLPKMAKMNPGQVRSYFAHDIENLYLTAHGYCDFPYAASDVIQFVEQATYVNGFAEVYALVKPLLTHPDFIQFLGSEASQNFMKELAPLAQKHLFQDVFTLIQLHLQTPLTNDGGKIATLLDGILKPLSDQDVQALMSFLTPVMTSDESFGEKFTDTCNRILTDFPEVALELKPDLRAAVKKSAGHILQISALASTLDLTSNLIRQMKLNGIIDQSLAYLSALLERGRFAYSDQKQQAQQVFLPSTLYLLDKITDTARSASVCDTLSYEWTFTAYTPANSDAYLKQINAIQKCVDPNQTFASAKDLINYAISQSSFETVLKLQRQVVVGLFKSDEALSLNTLTDFVNVGRQDSNTIRKYLNLGSLSMGLLKSSFLAKNSLRKTVADFVNNPVTYQALAEVTGPTPNRLRSSAPTLDLPNLTHVNAMVTHTQVLNQAPVEEAVKAIMLQYCPSLDPGLKDCEIDEDQVRLYQRSPKLLFQAIANEEMNSTQSFMHPALSTRWEHEKPGESPSEEGMFNYHLNPALHLFHHSPSAAQSLLTTLSRVKHDHIDLASFLKERASRLVLIPYVYGVPGFPAQTNREYHDYIRIRLLNDLDRLELVALNADFKAFDVWHNIGIGFLRDIAFAWGDEPMANRPSSLSHFPNENKGLTLKQVRDQIEDSMSRYDRSFVQKLGNCNPSNHSRLVRWMIGGTCDKVSDISSRIFNLRFLLPLLTDELPTKDGGNGGLVLLRDLFYSLYEANSSAQINHFPNGAELPWQCFKSPLAFDTVQNACQVDLLSLISRIAHLGLLHQAGTAVLHAKDNAISAVAADIDQVVTEPNLSSSFTQTLSSDAGEAFVGEAVDYAFQAPVGTAKNLSLLTRMMGVPKDKTWLTFGFEIIPKMPHFPSQNQALLNSLLSVDAESLKPWVDQWLHDSARPSAQVLTLISQKLTPPTRNDILTLLVEITPQSPTFANYLTTAKNLPDLNLNALKNDASLWGSRFATPALAKTREDLSKWTLSSEFNQFCDVFSDATLTTKAYNFLEAVNQNPDSLTFLQSCRDFLNLH